MKNKVLFLGDKFNIGGVPSIMNKMIDDYHSKKFEIIYCYIRTPYKIKGLEKRKQNNIIYIDSQKKYSPLPFFKILKIIKKHDIKIVHANGDKSSYFLPFLKLFYPNLKLVHHEHHTILVRNKFYATFLRLTSPLVNKYIAVSNYVSNELKKKAKIPQNKIKIVNNFSTLEAKPKEIKSKNKLNIGFVGRLEKLKGCEYLLRTVPHLLEFNKNFTVLIAGGGSLKNKLVRLAKKLNIQNKVKFLGYVNNPATSYKKIDILVIPSLSETFSLTLIEAWSFGIPAVVSNIPVFNDIVDDKQTGLIFKMKNANDLASKIKVLMTDSEIRKKISKNSIKESEKYTFDKFNKKLNKVYKNLL